GRERAACAAMTLALRVAMPLLSLALPALTVERPVPVSADTVFAPVTVSPLPAETLPLDMAPPVHFLPDESPSVIRPLPLIGFIYVAGVLLLAGRLVAGLLSLHHHMRAATSIGSRRWQAALREVRADYNLRRRPRLMRAAEACPPISFGLWRPVIMIDRAVERRPQDAAAIIRHEMAHIAHHDFALRLLSKSVRALFWFNPFIWIIDRRLEACQEEAADDVAVRRVARTDYSQALLNAANDRVCPYAANGIAASTLERRLKDLLSGRPPRHPRRAAMATGALLSVAITAPVAALQFQDPVSDVQSTESSPSAEPQPATTPAPPAIRSVPVPVPAAPPPPAFDARTAEADVMNEGELAQAEVPPVPAIPAPPVIDDLPALAPSDPPQVALIVRQARERELRLEHAAQMREERAREHAARMEAHKVRMEAHRAEMQAHKAKMAARREARQARIEMAVEAQVETAMAATRNALSNSADGLIRGAESMAQGADRMEAEGRRLCEDEQHRQRIIDKKARQGRTITHEELRQAGEGMIAGAEGMRDGAMGMREAAEDMLSERL
ncbi:MAG: M56 family metallopeptidase, partial [Pseudomonadota bacterium]